MLIKAFKDLFRKDKDADAVTGSRLPNSSRFALDINSFIPELYLDAFGRLKVSTPVTLFDSKQIFDDQSLFFDDQQTSGSGTSSTYNTNEASVSISVSANTAGKRVRQTFQRFNYKPGKALNMVFTANLSTPQSGITANVGYFDDDNGIYFSSENGKIYIVRRSKTSGIVQNEKVLSSDWNGDPCDGTGPSGLNIDPTKCQIMFIDIEWLGVGRVRCGFFYKGSPVIAHTFYHANEIKKVYMSTPNLPIRYEIENDGTGPASTLLHICSSVNSEGTTEKTGVLRHADSGSIGSLSSGTKYAVIGIRLKSGFIGLNTLIENISMLATSTNDIAHWELIFNPTVAGTFTYSDVSESGVQIATGANTNTVTGGYELDGGYFTNALPTTAVVPNALSLGSAIDGTVDEIVLCCVPITNNITVQGSLTWRELS